MVKINFLPWRQHAIAYQNKCVRNVIGITILTTCLMLLSAHIFLTHQLTKYQSILAILNNKLTEIRNLSRNDSSTDSTNPLTVLRRQHIVVKELFLKLDKNALQNWVCFTEIKHSQNTFEFFGNAHSSADLLCFFNHWKVTSLFSEIKIEQLNPQDDHLINFHFVANEK